MNQTAIYYTKIKQNNTEENILKINKEIDLCFLHNLFDKDECLHSKIFEYIKNDTYLLNIFENMYTLKLKKFNYDKCIKKSIIDAIIYDTTLNTSHC